MIITFLLLHLREFEKRHNEYFSLLSLIWRCIAIGIGYHYIFFLSIFSVVQKLFSNYFVFSIKCGKKYQLYYKGTHSLPSLSAKRIEMVFAWLERSQLLILFIPISGHRMVQTDFEFFFFLLLLLSSSLSLVVVVVNFARLLAKKRAQTRCIINANNIFFSSQLIFVNSIVQ